MISIDLDKARNITKERLRRERQPLLEALDVQFIRALESNADTSSILAEKQRLRDITSLADSAASIAELAALELEAPHAPA